MAQRIVSLWFPQLMTDWKQRRQPELRDVPFAMAMQERNRKVIKAVNLAAQAKGIFPEMAVADCKAILPELELSDYDPEKQKKILFALAEWCIRYTPLVCVDLPDGLILDASGCPHLWGGEAAYLTDITRRFNDIGYSTKIAIADTIGTAWAACHYGQNCCTVAPGDEMNVLAGLPPGALRLETPVIERLQKLGLHTIGSFSTMPRTALRRRFGQSLLTRLDQALGAEMELLEPIDPPAPYEERLPCLEPVCTATGIEIGLKALIETLCLRLNRESKGLRQCELHCYRIDGALQRISIGTSRPSRNTLHLFKLFENRISQIEPGLGIELFVLSAPVVEELPGTQDALWAIGSASEAAIAELQDRLAGKIGGQDIVCYAPQEHHWPEYSIAPAPALIQSPLVPWRTDLPRPTHLLSTPEEIKVSVPMPDYPPLFFIYKNTLYTVRKADGPERVEQEWWKQAGLYRDYYCVEDEGGSRYWLFRSGDYNRDEPKWFIHGFFS